MYKSHAVRIMIFISLFFVSFKTYAIDYGNNGSLLSGTSAWNAFQQMIGEGDGTTLNSFYFDIYSPAGVSLNNNSFKLLKFDNSSYDAGSYVGGGCGTHCVFVPVSNTYKGISCEPTSRCTDTGSYISVSSHPTESVRVLITANTAVTLTSGFYYSLGYSYYNTGLDTGFVGSSVGNSVGDVKGVPYNTAVRYDYFDTTWVEDTSVKGLSYGINDWSPVPIPSGSVTSQTINTQNQTITISGAGDFDLTDVGYSARLIMFKNCTSGSGTGDFEIQGHSVATINFYADDNVTQTIKTDENNVYTGAGYTSTDSTYYFSGVTLPYDVGLDCSYPTFVQIFDETGANVFDTLGNCSDFEDMPVSTNWWLWPIDENIDYSECMEESIIDFVPDGSTTHVNYIPPEVVDTENLGILAQINMMFNGMVNDVLRSLFDTSKFMEVVPPLYDTFVDNLKVRQPFCYVFDIFEADIHTANLSDGIPNMVISFNQNYGMQDVAVDFPSTFDDLINTIRTFIEIAIYFLFFMYILSLVRRFLP